MEIARVFAPEPGGRRGVGGAVAQLNGIRKGGGGLIPQEEKCGTTNNDLVAMGQRTFENRKAIHERAGEAAEVLNRTLLGVEGQPAVARRNHAVVDNQIV